jgi:hypothetical protein
MRPKSSSKLTPGERVAKDIRRAARRHFSAEVQIRIVLDGLSREGLIDRHGVTVLTVEIHQDPSLRY